MPMILFFGGHTNRIAGFSITVAVYGFLMILGYLYIYRITAGKDPYDETLEEPSKRESHQSVREIVMLVFRNPPLMFLTLAQVFASTSLFVITALAAYFFTYVAGKPAFLAVFMMATSISRLAGTFAAPWIGVRLGKRNTYWIFLAVAAVAFASGRLFSEMIWAYTFVFCIASMLAAVTSSMNTALFADTVVYGEWKTGRNIRAFTMALMNLPIKVGILLRSGIVTIGLISIGFVANATPTPQVINGISSIMTLTPAAAYGIAALIFFFGYRIEEKHVMQMQEEINAGRTAAEARRVR
jgi:glycoside/pentoside/hexuronide:cation symporter, GPH family